MHLRRPAARQYQPEAARAQLDKHADFLDSLDLDAPSGCWSAVCDDSSNTVTLRSLLYAPPRPRRQLFIFPLQISPPIPFANLANSLCNSHRRCRYPGFFFYHVLGSSSHGRLYVGNAERNYDLAFMLS
jgi:hypothetical protein